MLPPGSLFLLLSLLTFGLTPEGVGKIPEDFEELDECIDEVIDDCILWIKEKDTSEAKAGLESEPLDWRSRIRKAIDFSRSCVGLGAKLVCFSDKVKLLCDVFDFVDGYEVEA